MGSWGWQSWDFKEVAKNVTKNILSVETSIERAIGIPEGATLDFTQSPSKPQSGDATTEHETQTIPQEDTSPKEDNHSPPITQDETKGEDVHQAEENQNSENVTNIQSEINEVEEKKENIEDIKDGEISSGEVIIEKSVSLENNVEVSHPTSEITNDATNKPSNNNNNNDDSNNEDNQSLHIQKPEIAETTLLPSPSELPLLQPQITPQSQSQSQSQPQPSENTPQPSVLNFETEVSTQPQSKPQSVIIAPSPQPQPQPQIQSDPTPPIQPKLVISPLPSPSNPPPQPPPQSNHQSKGNVDTPNNNINNMNNNNMNNKINTKQQPQLQPSTLSQGGSSSSGIVSSSSSSKVGGMTSAFSVFGKRKEENDEKDEVIKSLRAEGEALSKKNFQYEQIIKTLRAKIKENDQAMGLFTERVTSSETLLEQKIERIKRLEEDDRKNNEALTALKAIVDNTTKKNEELKRHVESYTIQNQDLLTHIEKLRGDLAEQKKINSGKDNLTEQKVSEVQASVRDEFSALLKQNQSEWNEKELSYSQTIEELRSEITRIVDRYAWREEELRKEIIELKQRCEDAEKIKEELTTNIMEVSKPLYRDIEALRSAHEASKIVWENLEFSLRSRIKEEEEKHAETKESLNASLVTIDNLGMKLKSVEGQLQVERQSQSRLTAELQTTRSSLNDSLMEVKELKEKMMGIQRSHEKVIAATKERETQLVSDLTASKAQIFQLNEKLDKQTTTSYPSMMIINNEQRSQTKSDLNHSGEYNNNTTTNNSGSTTTNPTINTLINNNNKLMHSSSDITNRSVISSNNGGNNMAMMMAMNNSFNGGVGNNIILPSGSFSSAAVEKLQLSVLKKDSEILSLQSQIATLEKNRITIEDQLLKLTTSNQELINENKQIVALKDELEKLNLRHKAALELLGEREEQLEELKADLVDVKQLYKQQINELLSKMQL